MIPFIAENLAPIMFGALVILLLFGYPAAFALAANGLLFFVIGVELAPMSSGQIHLFWPLLHALPDRFFGGVMANETLLAVPFFTFMGLILERSGMAEDLLDTVGQLFGPIRGGLAYAVVFVGALLAATTGVTAASVIAMGLISLPIMLRYGYDPRLASGVITASGTLAQIIPPSLVLIVLADQLGRSVGDMYAGAIVPGLVLTGLYLVYVTIMAVFNGRSAPALPLEARTLGSGVTSLIVALIAAAAISYGATLWFETRIHQGAAIWGAVVGILAVYFAAIFNKVLKTRKIMSYLAQQVIIVLIPPLALIFLVLGTIFLGIATPTEGGAMGAVGALVLAFAKRRFSMPLMIQAMQSTATLSAFVLFILIGSRVFSLTFYGVNGHLWVEHLLLSVPGGETGFLIVVNVMVFFLAFFLDFFELSFIIVPLLAPVADKLGIDLIWFGVLLGINMQTSFLHPPFGFALFYLRSVAPNAPYLDKVTGKMIPAIRTSQIYWGAVPFVCIQILMVALTIMFPGMVLRYKGEHQPVPIEQITIPQIQENLALPPLGGGGDKGANNPLGLPPLNFPGGGTGGQGSSAAPAKPEQPAFGLPPLKLGGEEPTTGGSQDTGNAPAAGTPAKPEQTGLGLPPLELGGEKPGADGSEDIRTPAPSAPKPEPQPSTDLSQPPSFD